MPTAVFHIRGTSPYVQNKFGEKTKQQMRDNQIAGSVGRKGKKREGKDFQELYEAAKYRSRDGQYGMPAGGFRAALISACKLVGFHMTKGKISLFVEADGYDKEEGTPLVYFTKGEPHYSEHPVRLETGVADLRARPMWDEGWEAELRVRYDADLFSMQDVANLLMRVGMQVGIGEGRADSKKSCGMGWGFFEIVQKGEKRNVRASRKKAA
jgi:hypothetical protein